MNSSLGGYGHSDLHLRLMHVFGAWCFQCSGIPRLTYERHQRGKDTSCRAGAMGARGLSPHRLQHPVTAGHGQPSWHETGKPGTGSWRTQGILASSDVSRRGHRRSCIEKGDWVAYPVDLQGKRLLGMAWPELQRFCTDPIRYNHAVPGRPTAEGWKTTLR